MLHDPLVGLYCMEDELWDSSLLTNPQLHEKMWNVAHGQTWNIMAIKWMEANVASPGYQSMYCRIFKALITKKVASKTSDSCALTPSVTQISEYMDSDLDMGKPIQGPEFEGRLECPSTHNPRNVSFVDPMVEDMMTQMCAPQQPGESMDSYCHQCDVTICLDHAVNDAPANHADYLKATHTEDTKSTQPVT